jgi:hypothetical protein
MELLRLEAAQKKAKDGQGEALAVRVFEKEIARQAYKIDRRESDIPRENATREPCQ